MKASLMTRMARLEQTSFLGTQAELDECEFVFMRVPEGYQADPQFEKSQALASKLGKHLICLDSAAAHSLPPWALLPLNRLSDESLDDLSNQLERSIAASQSVQSQIGKTLHE